MRCPTCEYALWNVRGRTCPECGNAFNPEQAHLTPNLVQFCCPGCDQCYYGTDEHGLPVPRLFTCVRCGERCSLAENLVLRPVAGIDEHQIEQSGAVPWTRRDSLGLWKAWRLTLWRCIVAPSRIGRGLRGTHAGRGSSGGALWLLMITTTVFLGMSAFSTAGLAGVLFLESGRVGMRRLVGTATEYVIVAAVLMAALWVLVCGSALISWLVLYPADRTLPWARVFACWAYACTACLILAAPILMVPCASVPLAAWVPILAGLMLAQCTTAAPGRVVLAVCIPPLLGMLVPFAWILLMIWQI